MAKHQFTSRTKARKRAADVVFEADQRGMGRNPDVLRNLLLERKVVTAALTPLPEYSQVAVAGVAEHLSRIDRLIANHANVAGLDRIPAVDLAVLRVATWEILENGDDVPAAVAIDEAISIVKSISTDSSPGFVNAVLDAIRRELDVPAWNRERRLVDEDAEGLQAADQDAVAQSPDPGDDAEPVQEAGPLEGPARANEEPAGEAEPLEGSARVSEAPANEVKPEEGPARVDEQPTAEPEHPSELTNGEPLAGHEPDEGDEERAQVKRYPTIEDLTSADLEELDELLDEY